MVKISVVINTWNEEENLPRVLASVKGLADELVVVDMESSDRTVEIARRAGAAVYTHKYTAYVEPARNFAIGKAIGDWILVLDADEELTGVLRKKLRELGERGEADYYRLPRKNLIFHKWMRHSRWWPDYNIRFFKNGAVTWSEVIHSVPETRGKGADLPEKEENAIWHYHYENVEQFVERMNRYTTIQAKLRIKKGERFLWQETVKRMMGEFFSRFFSGRGYKDGFHGLALSFLQSMSELVTGLKMWQIQGHFHEYEVTGEALGGVAKAAGREFSYWEADREVEEREFWRGLPGRLKRKWFSR